MKRYFLFAGEIYDPRGGMNDFKGDFDTIEEAQQHGIPWAEWAHIWDTHTGVMAAVQNEGEPWDNNPATGGPQ